MTIFDAINQGNLEGVKAHFQTGGSSNDRHPEHGYTPLMSAVGKRQMAIVEYLLAQRDVDVNAVDPIGRTALMYAVVGGASDIVRKLMDKGAHVGAVANNAITALKLAANRKYTDMIVLFLNAGANPLHSMNGEVRAIDMSILQCDVLNTIHMMNAVGIEAALHVLNKLDEYFGKGDAQKVKDYLFNLHKFFVKDEDGNSLLHLAAARNHVNLIPILSEYTDINITNNELMTPAHIAAAINRAGALRAIYTMGGNLEANDLFGRTPYSLALSYGAQDAANLLTSLLAPVANLQNTQQRPLSERYEYRPWAADDYESEIENFAAGKSASTQTYLPSQPPQMTAQAGNSSLNRVSRYTLS